MLTFWQGLQKNYRHGFAGVRGVKIHHNRWSEWSRSLISLDVLHEMEEIEPSRLKVYIGEYLRDARRDDGNYYELDSLTTMHRAHVRSCERFAEWFSSFVAAVTVWVQCCRHTSDMYRYTAINVVTFYVVKTNYICLKRHFLPLSSVAVSRAPTHAVSCTRIVILNCALSAITSVLYLYHVRGVVNKWNSGYDINSQTTTTPPLSRTIRERCKSQINFNAV